MLPDVRFRGHCARDSRRESPTTDQTTNRQRQAMLLRLAKRYARRPKTDRLLRTTGATSSSQAPALPLTEYTLRASADVHEGLIAAAIRRNVSFSKESEFDLSPGGATMLRVF